MREELKIEKYLVSKTKVLGGIAMKFVSPNLPGVPDRIVILNKQICFVELKAPGESPRPRQNYMIRKLRNLGMNVEVIDSKEGIDELLERMNDGI